MPFISAAPLTQHFTFPPISLLRDGRTDEGHVWTSTQQSQASRQLVAFHIELSFTRDSIIIPSCAPRLRQGLPSIDRLTIVVNISDRTWSIERSIASHFLDDLIHDTSTVLRPCVSAASAPRRPMLPRWTKTRYLARQGRRAVFDDKVPANQQAHDVAPPRPTPAYPSCHLATEHRIPRSRL